jgi:hypothetical protein
MINIGEMIGKSVGNKQKKEKNECQRISWNFN